eukprot:jgi/Ulvmu1/9445/UM052_0009.1
MDAETRKRTLQSLLNTGRSGQQASAASHAGAAVGGAARAVRHAAEPAREAGGFFREELQAPAERDTLGVIATSVSARPQPGSAPLAPPHNATEDEEDWNIDDSDVLLAIKMLSDRFLKRGAPKGCPSLALHSQLQDTLSGQSNLELDQELQRLQDSSDIVVLKFSSNSSDSVVLLYSEFVQAMDRLTASAENNENATDEDKHKYKVLCAAVTTLCSLIASGTFRVQMPEPKLIRAMEALSHGTNSTSRARADAEADAARRADVLGRRRPARRRSASRGSGGSEDEGSGGGADTADRGARGNSATASAAASASVGAAAAVPGKQLVEALLQAGVLLRHTSGPVSIMRLSVPGVGSVMAAVERARKEVTLSLRRRRKREAILKTLLDTPLKSSRLGWDFHLKDMAGKGLVARVTHGTNTVIRLVEQ